MCRARVYVHSASIALSKSKLVGGVVPSASRSFWWAGLISRLQRLYFATFGDASHPQPSADSRKHKCLQLVSGQPRRRQCWEAPNLLPACSRHSWLRFDDSLDFLSASKDESFVKATGFLPCPEPACAAHFCRVGANYWLACTELPHPTPLFLHAQK